jgi:formylglycine-generating enzyme required for sulfatase activity/tetratricopeptide (TPR) repeat protein
MRRAIGWSALIACLLVATVAVGGEVTVMVWQPPARIRILQRDATPEVAAEGDSPLIAALATGYYEVIVERAGQELGRFPVKVTDPALQLELDLEPPAGFCFVPAGPFVFGNGYNGPMLLRSPPQQRATYAFYGALHEVTCAQYAAFIADLPSPRERIRHLPRIFHGHPGDEGRVRLPDEFHWPSGVMPASYADYPVRGINCTDALAYAAWAGWRLATEPEWEKAARGVDGRQYPWGDRPDPTDTMRFNYHPVGVQPLDRSLYGLLDVSSGMHEWTYTPGSDDVAVVKGGSYEHAKLQKPFMSCGWRMVMPLSAEPTGTDKGMRVFLSALPPAADLEAALTSEYFGIRHAALQRLAAHPETNPVRIARVLADAEPHLRAVAAWALLRRGAAGLAALVDAIASGAARGDQALDALWRSAATQDSAREALTGLWLGLTGEAQAAFGALLFARIERDGDGDWPMQRYLTQNAWPLIQARFRELLEGQELRFAECYLVDVEADSMVLAQAYVQRRNYEQAILAYRRAGQRPDAATLATWLDNTGRSSLARAMVIAAQGDHQAAIVRLRRLAGGEHRQVRPHLELARSLMATNGFQEARSALERAERIAPFSTEIAALRQQLPAE